MKLNEYLTEDWNDDFYFVYSKILTMTSKLSNNVRKPRNKKKTQKLVKKINDAVITIVGIIESEQVRGEKEFKK